MGSDIIDYPYPLIDDIIGKIAQFCHDAADRLTEVNTVVRALDPAWYGDANGSFNQAQTVWDGILVGIERSANSLGRQVHSAAAAMKEADIQLAGSFKIY